MQQTDRPPMICSVCVEHQDHHPLDHRKEAFYCPHVAGGVWVIRSKDGKDWHVRQGVDPGEYRLLTRIASVQAGALAMLAAQQQTEVLTSQARPTDPLQEKGKLPRIGRALRSLFPGRVPGSSGPRRSERVSGSGAPGESGTEGPGR